MIIDFHSHLKRNPLTHQYEVESQLADMDKNGIAMRVLSCFDGPLEQGNDEVVKLAQLYPDRFIPCAAINPKQDDALMEVRRQLWDHHVRLIEMDSLESGFLPETLAINLIEILEECQACDAAVMLFTGATHRGAPDQWRAYFDRFPQLNFILLHMGAGDFQYGTIALAGEYRNLWLETSVACEYPAFKKALAELNIQRFLFGSHFPDYFTELELMKFDHYALSASQKEMILGQNAQALLDLLKKEA